MAISGLVIVLRAGLCGTVFESPVLVMIMDFIGYYCEYA
jgi:hypothetical protein